jgi:hypothetical protein
MHTTTPPPFQAAATSRADPGTSEQRWKAVRAHIAKGDKAKDKAEQHYIAAGHYLAALKREHTGTWAEWESLVKTKAGIGKSRASELMTIADGTKTAAEVAAATTERSQRHRALSPLRNGENADDPETSAETMKAEFAASDGAAAADGAAAVDDADGSAPSPLLPPPPAASESSWRVELTTDDGTRRVNGVRLKTKVEAALYAIRSAQEILSPLWRPILRKAGHEPLIVVMTRVLASADAVNCEISFPKNNRRAELSFPHGGCRLLRWHPEGETDEPGCPAAGAAASVEARHA